MFRLFKSVYINQNKQNYYLMKNLIKPQSSQYFRRYEKPPQDPEVTMNNIQAKKLALYVGIDISQIKQFPWFFELINKSKLPQKYSRYLNATRDAVIYFNEATHEETYEHPSARIFKIFFYQTLSNNKTIYTFADKQSKLLPFVEQKMVRQSIGLNSKRRQAEKVNLQKDENGKMVISKLQKVNPDFKSLLASRSYMLKMLVEKVYTKREIIGKGKRAASYLAIISEYRQMMKQSSPQKQDQQMENQQNLALYQNIFQKQALFYLKEFGNLQDIPPSIINSKEYLQSTPQNVLKNIFLLNVEQDNIELYWLARMMDCLPLPPSWSKKRGTIFDSYFYEPEKLLFDVHPSYIYIMYQLNKFKSIFKSLGGMRQNYYLNMRQLNFFDFFQRKYTVDMYGYIQNSKKKAEKIKGKEKDKLQLKISQNSDWMVLEGVNNTQIPSQALVVIEHIERFWDALDFKQEPWCPAISPYGQVVWSSNVNYKSINFNPYRSKLSTLVKNQIKKLPAIKAEDLKQQYKATQQQEVVSLNVEKMQEQRYQFLTYYLSHIQKALPWPYQIKQNYPLLDQNNYYQQVFVSPFELDKDLLAKDQEVPLWLEKARAKNHTIHHTNLLIFNPHDFLSIKEQIAQYALEMVGEHEPHLLQQTEKKIYRITNPEDLIKFLQFINDIDLREQRKKEYIQSLKKDEEESDIFGSQISQVDVEQRMQDQSNEAEQQHKSVQEAKEVSVEQKSVHQEDEEEIVHQQSEQTIENDVPDEIVFREQYGFLENFKKPAYKPDQQINLDHQGQVEKKLLKAIKNKIKKSKYKKGILKRKVMKQIKFAYGIIDNSIQIIDEDSSKQRILIKKNQTVTRLRSIHLPYRYNFNLAIQKERFDSKQDSEMGCSQITDYEQFRSEVSDYDGKQVRDLILQLRKIKKSISDIRSPTEQSINEHEQTMDTVQLEPIRQIKPQINLDPVLRHIKMVSTELNEFRSTFNSKIIKASNKDIQQNNLRKGVSVKSLSNKDSNYISTPIRNSSLKKIDLESRLSFARKEGLPKLDSIKPFHRVCLEKTASHFLQKQAFLKKGDLVTLEARKSLLSKGRGIETYISKFY